MSPSFTWQALDGQGWPATQDQERVFVDDLRRAATGRAPSTRPAVTCVLNALRCGITLAELRDTLPGVLPAEMLAGYNELDRALHQARTAWQRIVENPTAVTLIKHSATAEQLLPVPVHRITGALVHLSDTDAVTKAARQVLARIGDVTGQAHAAENGLSQLRRSDPRGVQLGRMLHDVSAPGLWSNEYFLPRRVGELSPTRVVDLRGDVRG